MQGSRTVVIHITLSFSKSASVTSLMAINAPEMIIATTTAHVTAPTTHFRLTRRRSVGDDGPVAPWACAHELIIIIIIIIISIITSICSAPAIP